MSPTKADDADKEQVIVLAVIATTPEFENEDPESEADMGKLLAYMGFVTGIVSV